MRVITVRYCFLLATLVFLNTPAHAEFGDELGTFDYVVTAVEVQRSDGGQVLVVHCEGEASGYGHVKGSLTLYNINSKNKSGPALWQALTFPTGADEYLTDFAPGSWSVLGEHRWKIHNVSNVSDGAGFGGDGVLDTKNNTFKGRLFEWN